MAKIWIVLQKEVLDNLRDRRAITSTLLGTLLGPGLMLLLFFVIGRTVEEQTERVLELPVIGAENAPSLISYLEQNMVEIVEPPPNPEEAVRVGDLNVVLVIDANFGESLNQGMPAELQLIVDDSRQSSSVVINRVENLLREYSSTIVALRLVARGISPVILSPLAVENVDVATPQSETAELLSMMPYFLIFSVFLGGMHLAIDTTAGERERGSLEPLLINPVTRRELVLGKLGATIAFTLVSVIGTLVAFWIMLALVPLEGIIGTQVSLELGSMARIFLITLPMVLLAASIQSIIAAFSRNYKEAQSYLSFLPLVPALPGMFLAFVPVRASLWMMLIPTFGQQLIINQVMRQEPVLPLNVVISSVVTVVIALALVWVAVWLYRREQILFGR
jgi:sodium transport system permease protein